MEVEFDGDTTRIPIGTSTATEIGRGVNFSSSDRTVSRRHLSVRLLHQNDLDGEPIVLFQVIGKNPVLVVTTRDGEEKREMFRTGEKGRLGDGDKVSLSIKNPGFVKIRRVGLGLLDAVRRREERTLKRRKQEDERKKGSGCEGDEEALVDFGFERLDISQFDPVKDFGFLVRGHELDCFPKHKVRAVRDWNWFLDDSGEASDDDDDDDDVGNASRKRKKKKKKKKGIDDDWEGECEDEQTSVRSANRPKYSTRSNDQRKQTKDVGSAKDGIDEEDDDGSLGGFIVNDNEKEDDTLDEEDEEDEDFDADDDDDD